MIKAEKKGLQSHKSATFSYREWRRRAQERGADIDYDFFVEVSTGPRDRDISLCPEKATNRVVGRLLVENAY